MDEVTLSSEIKGKKDWFVDTKGKLNAKKIEFNSDFLSNGIKKYNIGTGDCITPRNLHLINILKHF